ncbi:MAG TPA: ThiF family adenylyltransferase, partial [Candidatus Limnocylindrales bacterium]|nr:ThiF family adenylyltransferase [Candidatus Limnocylindrales bacterium]
ELKADLAKREILKIAPTANVIVVPKHLPHPDAMAALAEVDLLIGGLDHDLPRLQLTDFASANGIPYIDAATDVVDVDGPPVYGGRVVCAGITPGCLHCLDQLDKDAIRRATMTDEQLAVEAAIYGVPVESLHPQTGPSVVTINSVVASLAITEAMALLTGLRNPQRHLVYRGDIGTVRLNIDPPQSGCPYCARWGRS